MNVNWIKQSILIFSLSVLLLLLVDFSIEQIWNRHEKNVNRVKNPVKIEKTYRVKHPVFDHTMLENYEGPAYWGGKKYKVCTNMMGFKTFCGDQSSLETEYDIAFIGDSFTEAIGMHYEDSFVGMIHDAYPLLSIAGMGVSSYSPTIYFQKLKYFIEKGLRVKHVVVYVDISDVQDETGMLIQEGRVKKIHFFAEELEDFKKNLKDIFPLTALGIYSIMNHFSLDRRLDFSYERSAWTYHPKSSGYSDIGVDGAIERSLEKMRMLYELLENHSIKMSVAVYPWPAQLLYDSVNSRHVVLWKNFCERRCEMFIESFTEIFELVGHSSAMSVIDDIYISHDVHFNRRGNEIIAQDFIDHYKVLYGDM